MKTLIFFIICGFIFLQLSYSQNLERYSWQCQNSVHPNTSEEFTFSNGKFIYLLRDTTNGNKNITKGSYRLFIDKLILKTKHKEIVYFIEWENDDEFYLSLNKQSGYLIYVLAGTPKDYFWKKTAKNLTN
ncbi:MAG: hypothetical protein ACOYL8_04995 [Patescibacteria group bacterium]